MSINPAEFLNRSSVGAPKQAIKAQTIAEHWGVSAGYISQLKKNKGMPAFHSLEQADAWRAANCAPSRKGKQKASAADPAPALDLDKYTGEASGDFVIDMLGFVENAARVAYARYMAVMEAGQDHLVASSLKNFSEATKQAAALRENFLELQEKAGDLLPVDIILDVTFTILQALDSSLDGFGRRYAKSANPENPELALQVMNDGIDKVKKRLAESRERITGEIMNRRETVEEKTQDQND